MTAVLQSYADRGVFRGFRATPAPPARVTYRFVWLTRQPVQAVFDTRTQTLAFPALLPKISTAGATDAAAVIASRAKRGIPDHKRIDARRARIHGAVRNGGFSLSIAIRGNNHNYGVKTALSVINEIFVRLQERHPEYLVEHFGMSPE